VAVAPQQQFNRFQPTFEAILNSVQFNNYCGSQEKKKRGRTRFKELRKRGVSKDLAAQTAGSAHGPWRIANSPALTIALSNAYFASLGLLPMVVRF